MSNRITFDGDVLDEIVLDDAMIHIEGLDAHRYMVRITAPGGVDLHFECDNLHDYDSMSFGDLRQDRPPLNQCGHQWDAPGTSHTCTRRPSRHWKHECDCGATPEEDQ